MKTLLAVIGALLESQVRLLMTFAPHWANSADNNLSHFSYFSQKIDLDISCKLSPKRPTLFIYALMESMVTTPKEIN